MATFESQSLFEATNLESSLVYSRFLVSCRPRIAPTGTDKCSGLLHHFEAILGRASIMFNFTAYDPSLADWSKPGFLGADLKTYTTRGIVPVPCHSHNDYSRRVPLYDAISWGCCSVEADVWLFDGELYVGHNTAELDRNRTLQNLYVKPLVDLLDTRSRASAFDNSTGSGVFETKPDQTFVLLIDVKMAGPEMLETVREHLHPLRQKDYLSYWDGQKVVHRAITVVVSGRAAFDDVVGNSNYRDIFYDAPLHSLWVPPRQSINPSDGMHTEDGQIDYGTAMSLPESYELNPDPARTPPRNVWTSDGYNTSTSYYASADFGGEVGFVWRGHLSPRQMNVIRGQIRGAKRHGLKVRYWNTPSWPTALRNHVWHVLVKEGADVLSVDDLKAAATDNWKVRTHDWWFW